MIITELFWISFGAFGIAFEFLGLYRVCFWYVLACVVLRCGVSVWIVVECVGFAFGVLWECLGFYQCVEK